jgi:hypothetical protein
LEDRLASLVAEGIELFAATDHDHLSDYDPLIDRLELRDWIDAVVGVESTSAVWGHFNAHPLEIDPSAPDGGPPDWADGAIAGLDMRPSDLFEAMRARGARVVQINHPRSLSLENHQAWFDRVGLTFDFARRTFHGDLDLVSVPASYMRLPGDEDLFSATFDALEVFNGFVPSDSDGDGVTDLRNLDRVMRDWMNFLSLGYVAVPIGNSDSHALLRTPAGLPRTLVRVGDDSASALRAGLEDEVYSALLESRDVVVTDGPMVRVTAGGAPAIGREVAADGGVVVLSIAVHSPEWIDFDTIEVFANATFDPDDSRETLIPLVCYTTRDPDAMHPEDPCLLASLPPRPLAVDRVDVTGDTEFFRREAAVELSLAEDEIPTRTGARGTDAWVVVRVRGQRALYPVLLQGVVTEGNLADLLAADTEAELAPLLFGRGVPAAAFTAPVFVDFDGGGYLAPFAP